MTARRGFSLIELLIVIAVMATLTGGSMLAYTDGFRRSAEAGRKHNLGTLRRAIDAFRADENRYPSKLDDLVRHRYLRELPEDPVTGTRRAWRPVPSAPGADDVYDVLPPREGGRS